MSGKGLGQNSITSIWSVSYIKYWLYSIKTIHVDTLRDDAVMTEFTEAILKERGLTAPIGEVRAQDGPFPG